MRPAQIATSVVNGVDLTVSLGNILTIISMLIATISFAFILRGKIQEIAIQTADLREVTKEIKKDLDKLTEVMIVQSRLDERLTAQDQRSVNQGKRLDDLYRRVNTYFDMRAVDKLEDGD